MRHRSDGNTDEIVTALKTAGLHVIQLTQSGNGVPDLCVLHHGRTIWIEIKNPKGRGSELTPAQIKFHDMAKLHGVKIHVVESVDQALDIFTHDSNPEGRWRLWK